MIDKHCSCPRNMPYFDWTHDSSCELYVPIHIPAAAAEERSHASVTEPQTYRLDPDGQVRHPENYHFPEPAEPPVGLTDATPARPWREQIRIEVEREILTAAVQFLDPVDLNKLTTIMLELREAKP